MLVSHFPSAASAIECPSDFTWNPSVNLCYKVSETQMLWQDSKTHCETLGARLVILDTTAKLDLLLSGLRFITFHYFLKNKYVLSLINKKLSIFCIRQFMQRCLYKSVNCQMSV